MLNVPRKTNKLLYFLTRTGGLRNLLQDEKLHFAVKPRHLALVPRRTSLRFAVICSKGSAGGS